MRSDGGPTTVDAIERVELSFDSHLADKTLSRSFMYNGTGADLLLAVESILEGRDEESTGLQRENGVVACDSEREKKNPMGNEGRVSFSSA